MSENQSYLRIEDAGGTIIAATFADVAKLYAKIGAVIAALPDLDKDKRRGQYSVTGYDNAAEVIGPALVKAGLSFTVAIVNHVRTGPSATVTLAMTLADTETGCMKIMQWISEWTDMGNDQGGGGPLPKAVTNGLLAWLKRQFLVSAEDGQPGGQLTGQRAGTTTGHATTTTSKPAPSPAPATTSAVTTTPPATERQIDHATGEVTEPTATAPTQPIRHPLPASDAQPGLKCQWMIDGFKVAGWDTYHVTGWLKKHFKNEQGRPASSVSELKNGRLEEAVQMLYLEINPFLVTTTQPAAAPAATGAPDTQIPF